MKRKHLWLCSLLGVVLAAFGAAKPGSPDGLIVHEWGTFLAMNGADGVTLDGMYHEEHALPAFVHARSKDQLRMPTVSIKGETPVIYFYTDQRQEVRVRVKFPRGIWTQWYPQANLISPSTTQIGSLLQPRNGHICWTADVIPAPEANAPALPTTEKGALWNYARDVDAAYVRTASRPEGGEKSEVERFLFYRGLGQATMPMRVAAADGGTLSWSVDAPGAARHIFVLRVENGKGVYRYLPGLLPGERLTNALPPMDAAQPLPEFAQKIGDDLAFHLIETGLYPKEARAMVNTWSRSYFQSEGVRVLFLLPQAWTDAFIPMEIDPQPKQIVRVMVGRLELLTPERARLAENAIRDLASPDAATRENAFTTLREQGRYVEPIVRRVLRTTDDAQTRTLCRRLLLTDFVTELRASTHSATDGAQMTDDPLYARAQLAALLREVGLDAQAKREGQAVYAAIQQRQAPPITESNYRPYGRAVARAMEAMGDDAGAAAWYGKFVRFGSQEKQCGGCHLVQGPRDMTFFRDWWAGRKYAQYASRVLPIDQAIARQEAALAKHPNDTAEQMLLAYLYDAKGEKDRAANLWARVEAPARNSQQAATRTARSL
jgi:hypothetical protein